MTGTRRYRERRYKHLPQRGLIGSMSADARSHRPKVLKILGLASGHRTDEHVGEYVRAFDPDALGGRGYLLTTAELSRAKVFPTFAEALAYWQTQSTTFPYRLTDGKPNRPLTAYHVLILDAARSDGE